LIYVQCYKKYTPKFGKCGNQRYWNYCYLPDCKYIYEEHFQIAQEYYDHPETCN
jgi:hypothetical protein